MNILSLDTSTYTGWAIGPLNHDEKEPVKSGVLDASIQTKATKTRPADHDGKRFWIFRDWLVRTIIDHDVGLIVYEKVVGGGNAGGRAALIQKGLEALVWEVAFANPWFNPRVGSIDSHARHAIPVWNFAAGTIKKFATGNGTLGKTGKVEMTEAAAHFYHRQQWVAHNKTKAEPWIIDDNQADAVWMWSLARTVALYRQETLEPQVDWTLATPDALTSNAQKVTHIKWLSPAKRRSTAS